MRTVWLFPAQLITKFNIRQAGAIFECRRSDDLDAQQFHTPQWTAATECFQLNYFDIIMKLHILDDNTEECPSRIYFDGFVDSCPPDTIGHSLIAAHVDKNLIIISSCLRHLIIIMAAMEEAEGKRGRTSIGLASIAS